MQSDHPRLVLYHSADIHSCVKKAAELLGLGSAGLRSIPVDASFKLRVDALRDAIAADRAAGRQPFAVAASAGTVNTGAIDPLDEIAEVCAAERLWFHVDGAYGAVGVLDPNVSARYRGLERADSVALDPHKWLNVPVECGCALVRDGNLLREAFQSGPAVPSNRAGQRLRRSALVLRVRLPAEPRLPGAQALDDAAVRRARRLYRADQPA